MMRRFYDERACDWDLTQSPHRPPAEEFLRSLRLRRGEDLLEVGCGTGWLVPALASVIAPGRLFVLDLSPRMLAHASVRRLATPLVVLVASACDIPLPDRSLDRVLMVNTFSQFDDQPAALREAARVLRPGGRLDIAYFFPREEVNRHHARHHTLSGAGLPDRSPFLKMLGATGFVGAVSPDSRPFRVSARRLGAMP